MKFLSIGKITIFISLLLTVILTSGLISDAIKYADATESIKNGDYSSASTILLQLDGYRDSEVLKIYCDIMNEYDANDFVSVYHCYRGLSGIEHKLNNNKINEEFTKTTTEVETLYKYYNISLSTK